MPAIAGVFRDQKGAALDYPNKTEDVIAAMQVIPFGARVGIAGCEIAPGETGSIYVEGVFAMPKAEGAGAITAGQEVQIDGDGYVTAYDGTAAQADGADSAPLRAGFAVEDSAADIASVMVKINA